MTLYLDTLTLNDLSEMTFDELAELGAGEIIIGCGHSPFVIQDIETFNSLYFIQDLENWS